MRTLAAFSWAQGVNHMTEFPRTNVGGVSLPRMIIGSNWFLGYSHTSLAKDHFIKLKLHH